MKNASKKLTRELVGGEWYEYVPLGKHIVAARMGKVLHVRHHRF